MLFYTIEMPSSHRTNEKEKNIRRIDVSKKRSHNIYSISFFFYVVLFSNQTKRKRTLQKKKEILKSHTQEMYIERIKYIVQMFK
jgi:hypothetical protein